MVLLSDVLMGLILPSDPVIRKNDDRAHARLPMYQFSGRVMRENHWKNYIHYKAEKFIV
jgi:hypothetical protein